MTKNQHPKKPFRRHHDVAAVRQEHIPAVKRLGLAELLTVREAAPLLRTTPGVLAIWRCKRKKALPYVRLGKKIYYRPEDIAAFINSRVDPGNGPVPAWVPKKKKQKS